MLGIGGSRGRAITRPPTGPNSFVFAYIFTEKCPRWRKEPPKMGPRPLTGNPGSGPVRVCALSWDWEWCHVALDKTSYTTVQRMINFTQENYAFRFHLEHFPKSYQSNCWAMTPLQFFWTHLNLTEHKILYDLKHAVTIWNFSRFVFTFCFWIPTNRHESITNTRIKVGV